MKQMIRLHLADEVRRLGSGFRWAEIDKVGHKWVYVRKPGSRRRIRVARTVWDRVKKLDS